MDILYIDESGCPGSLPAGPSNIQPVLCIAGLMVRQRSLHALTMDWIGLKRRFFPGLCRRGAMPFDWHRAEVKGSDLRRAFRKKAPKRERRATIGFVDRALDLIERHRCQLCARVWIKEPGRPFSGLSTYTFSVQSLCGSFQHRLNQDDAQGVVIADSRTPGPNSRVSHSIFTQKYQAAGDPYHRIVETPAFGHSDNHAGLQLCDVVSSTLLMPMCMYFFLGDRIKNLHVDPGYEQVGARYAARIKSLQYRYRVENSTQGGLVVSDPLGGLGAGRMFRHYCPQQPAVSIAQPPPPPTPQTTIVTPPATPPTPPTHPTPKE